MEQGLDTSVSENYDARNLMFKKRPLRANKGQYLLVKTKIMKSNILTMQGG